jgi:hypothetical protein
MNGRGNIRLGRSGIREGVCASAIALSVSGIFSLDTKQVYEHGNSSYITLPLAALIALLLFLALLKLMKNAGAADLFGLLSKGFGMAAAPFASAAVAILLLFSAYLPLSQFIQALHGLFFEGVSYARLAIFMVPAVLFLAWLGLEAVVRTAKCFSILIFIMFLLSVAASASEFEISRLFPLPGNSIRSIAVQTFEEIGLFLPVMISLLTVSEGFNDTETTKKIAIRASLISASILFIAQFSLGMIYTYTELSKQFMPIFRINHLNMFEAHMMRLDKVAHVVFLNGALISAAFYAYCAAYLLVRAFGLNDIRPMAALCASIIALLLAAETETMNNNWFKTAKEFLMKTGFLTEALPLFAAGIIAAIGRKRRKQYAC